MHTDKSQLTETVLELLRTGHSVELPATGLSMFPAIRPGERVVVRPVGKDERLERGAVVVCYEKGAGHRAHASSVALAKEEGTGEEEGAMAHRRNGAMAEELTGVFVMHRLIEIRKDNLGNTFFITRGDSLEWVDKPWRIDQLVGVAVSRKSGNRERKIKTFIPSGLRYRVNRWMLWGYGKWFRVSGFEFWVKS